MFKRLPDSTDPQDGTLKPACKVEEYLEALDTLLGCEGFLEDCEDGNYHGTVRWLEECRDNGYFKEWDQIPEDSDV